MFRAPTWRWATIGLMVTFVLALLMFSWKHPTPAAAAHEFRIHGRVSGLVPGVRTTMNVRIRNPLPSAIEVSRIRARAGTATQGCLGRNVAIRGFRGTRRVPAGGRIRIPIRIRLRRTAPDACQAARFPVVFTGEAVAA